MGVGVTTPVPVDNADGMSGDGAGERPVQMTDQHDHFCCSGEVTRANTPPVLAMGSVIIGPLVNNLDTTGHANKFYAINSTYTINANTGYT